MKRFDLSANGDGFHTDGYFTAMDVTRTWLNGDHVWFCEQGLREFFEIPDGVDRIAAIFTDKRPRGQDYYKLNTLTDLGRVTRMTIIGQVNCMTVTAPYGFTENVSVSRSVIAVVRKHGPYLQILY